MPGRDYNTLLETKSTNSVSSRVSDAYVVKNSFLGQIEHGIFSSLFWLVQNNSMMSTLSLFATIIELLQLLSLSLPVDLSLVSNQSILDVLAQIFNISRLNFFSMLDSLTAKYVISFGLLSLLAVEVIIVIIIMNKTLKGQSPPLFAVVLLRSITGLSTSILFIPIISFLSNMFAAWVIDHEVPEAFALIFLCTGLIHALYSILSSNISFDGKMLRPNMLSKRDAHTTTLLLFFKLCVCLISPLIGKDGRVYLIFMHAFFSVLCMTFDIPFYRAFTNMFKIFTYVLYFIFASFILVARSIDTSYSPSTLITILFLLGAVLLACGIAVGVMKLHGSMVNETVQNAKKIERYMRVLNAMQAKGLIPAKISDDKHSKKKKNGKSSIDLIKTQLKASIHNSSSVSTRQKKKKKGINRSKSMPGTGRISRHLSGSSRHPSAHSHVKTSSSSSIPPLVHNPSLITSSQTLPLMPKGRPHEFQPPVLPEALSKSALKDAEEGAVSSSYVIQHGKGQSSSSSQPKSAFSSSHVQQALSSASHLIPPSPFFMKDPSLLFALSLSSMKLQPPKWTSVRDVTRSMRPLLKEINEGIERELEVFRANPVVSVPSLATAHLPGFFHAYGDADDNDYNNNSTDSQHSDGLGGDGLGGDGLGGSSSAIERVLNPSEGTNTLTRWSSQDSVTPPSSYSDSYSDDRASKTESSNDESDNLFHSQSHSHVSLSSLASPPPKTPLSSIVVKDNRSISTGGKGGGIVSSFQGGKYKGHSSGMNSKSGRSSSRHSVHDEGSVSSFHSSIYSMQARSPSGVIQVSPAEREERFIRHILSDGSLAPLVRTGLVMIEYAKNYFVDDVEPLWIYADFANSFVPHLSQHALKLLTEHGKTHSTSLSLRFLLFSLSKHASEEREKLGGDGGDVVTRLHRKKLYIRAVSESNKAIASLVKVWNSVKECKLDMDKRIEQENEEKRKEHERKKKLERKKRRAKDRKLRAATKRNSSIVRRDSSVAMSELNTGFHGSQSFNSMLDLAGSTNSVSDFSVNTTVSNSNETPSVILSRVGNGKHPSSGGKKSKNKVYSIPYATMNRLTNDIQSLHKAIMRSERGFFELMEYSTPRVCRAYSEFILDISGRSEISDFYLMVADEMEKSNTNSVALATSLNSIFKNKTTAQQQGVISPPVEILEQLNDSDEGEGQVIHKGVTAMRCISTIVMLLLALGAVCFVLITFLNTVSDLDLTRADLTVLFHLQRQTRDLFTHAIQFIEFEEHDPDPLFTSSIMVDELSEIVLANASTANLNNIDAMILNQVDVSMGTMNVSDFDTLDSSRESATVKTDIITQTSAKVELLNSFGETEEKMLPIALIELASDMRKLAVCSSDELWEALHTSSTSELSASEDFDPPAALEFLKTHDSFTSHGCDANGAAWALDRVIKSVTIVESLEKLLYSTVSYVFDQYSEDRMRLEWYIIAITCLVVIVTIFLYIFYIRPSFLHQYKNLEKFLHVDYVTVDLFLEHAKAAFTKRKRMQTGQEGEANAMTGNDSSRGVSFMASSRSLGHHSSSHSLHASHSSLSNGGLDGDAEAYHAEGNDVVFNLHNEDEDEADFGDWFVAGGSNGEEEEENEEEDNGEVSLKIAYPFKLLFNIVAVQVVWFVVMGAVFYGYFFLVDSYFSSTLRSIARFWCLEAGTTYCSDGLYSTSMVMSRNDLDFGDTDLSDLMSRMVSSTEMIEAQTTLAMDGMTDQYISMLEDMLIDNTSSSEVDPDVIKFMMFPSLTKIHATDLMDFILYGPSATDNVQYTSCIFDDSSLCPPNVFQMISSSAVLDILHVFRTSILAQFKDVYAELASAYAYTASSFPDVTMEYAYLHYYNDKIIPNIVVGIGSIAGGLITDNLSRLSISIFLWSVSICTFFTSFLYFFFWRISKTVKDLGEQGILLNIVWVDATCDINGHSTLYEEED
ncbi:hypothetical protein ADUPG1_009033 [Aduncisulcus paluster]|uniref:RGS domain-containing protein n=1 Tax=Aduncisulcus paluster TaxID=2918883 RepID=A0ABQ5KU50_9EUKA|nr:hypothetical protein ADUPG1_009033 [Aduncisulcus paluster]